MTALGAAAGAGRSPLAAYPASYFTGPLGQRNVVPNGDGGLVMLWYEDDTGVTATQKRTNIQQRMTDCGRAFDCIGIHYGGIDSQIPGRGGGHLGSGGEAWVHSQGSIPVVSWVHNRYTRGTTNLNTMTEINNGLHDSIITEAANYWEGLGYRILWRPFWEFDGNWFPWSPVSGTANDGYPNPGCTAAAWISAWQRCVGLVQDAGASNVGFWWCPTAWNNETWRTDCYPGDAYVDWVGADCYNQASASVQTSPLGAGWREFWELFDPTGHGTSLVSVHNQFGPSKPFMVGETGSLYDDGDVNRKANWYRNIQDAAYAMPDMPYLCGIEFFDANLTAEEGFDWRVDRDQNYTEKQAHTPGSVDATTYQGFQDFVAEPVWNVGAVGGAT